VIVLVLMVGAAVVAVIQSGPAVSQGPPMGPCQALKAELRTPGVSPGAVAADFGFPAMVPVPASLEVRRVVCVGTRPDTAPAEYVLHAVFVEDVSGRAWLVRSSNGLDDMDDNAWRQWLADHGVPSVVPTDYGFATEAGAGPSTVSLWDKLAESNGFGPEPQGR
jgi:hypothetical protein